MHLRSNIAAGFIGNVVEWYDFALYGYMAGVIAPLFFPAGDRALSLIAAYGVFAAGFVMRPLGAVFFGWIGDRFSRQAALLSSVILMAIPTVLLGLLPTYAQAGLIAPVLLIILRMVQGLSVGGEFASSVTYLAETAEPGRRGLTTSWANFGSMTGMLAGVFAAALTTTWTEPQTLLDWGWRLPFLFGGVLGVTSIWMRRNLKDRTKLRCHAETRPATSPLRLALVRDRRITLTTIVFAAGYSVGFYIVLVYTPQWLAENGLMPRDEALRINTIATFGQLILIPLAGFAGDRFLRRRSLLLLGLGGLALSIWPLYAWMMSGTMLSIVVSHAVLFVLIAIPLGSAPAMFAEAFPASDRLSGYAVSFNIGVGVIGGMTPMMSVWLQRVTGWQTAPALYLLVMATAGIAALSMMPDRSREALDAR